MTNLFKNILFPVDFSARCLAAASGVAAIAHRFDSKVTLLHAIGDYADMYSPEAASSIAWREWLLKDAEPRLQAFSLASLAPYIVARCVEDGEPADAIQQFAADHEIDLIAMPTRGRGKLRRLLLGSVTSKVLHDSVCPVWTTAHSDSPEAPGVTTVRNVLCALDFSGETERIFDAARAVAWSWSAQLRLLHVVPVPGAPQEEKMNREFAQFLVDTATDQIAGMQKKAGTTFEVSVRTGDVANVIRETALEYSADTVVIGRGHVRTRIGRLWSSAVDIVRESPCPVLSF